MPKISIIIPVYNSSKYISKCIESILNQTEADFEVLLIDDGSLDGSGNICDRYAVIDSRIRVFHKQNGGVSSARNLGLDNALGEMIFFIDSDDTVDKDYLEKLMIKSDEDYVISGVKILENDFLKPVMTNNEIFSDFNRFWMESRQWWPFMCCLSKKIIDEKHLRYNPDLKMGEDGLFNLLYLSYCKKVRRIQYNGYNYTDNSDSASHKLYLDRLEQQVKLMKELEKYFSKNDLQRMKWDLWNEVINHYEVKGVNSDDENIVSVTKKKLKDTYCSEVFRESLAYIRNEGSLDEKIRSYFMGIYKCKLYSPLIKIIQLMYRLKFKFLKASR